MKLGIGQQGALRRRHVPSHRVPVEGDGGNRLELFLRAMERALDLRQRGDYDLAPAAAIERSFASLWKTDLHKLVAEGLGPQPVPFDYFELLQEINRTAALKGAEVAWKQGRPRAGIAAMDTLEVAIPACAAVANTRVEMLNQLASEAASANGESSAAELGRRLAAEAYQWEGGETPESAVAYKLSGYAVEVRYLDEPPPRFRSWTDDETLRMSGSDQQAIERWLRRNLRGLGYEERGASVLNEIENNLRLLGRSDEFEAILQANAHRYVGSR
jgi:hypothetical protein